MSDVPALREALRDTAERRYGRRVRLPRPVLAAGVVVAAIATMVFIVGRDIDDETTYAGIGPASTVQLPLPLPRPDTFSVLDRPQRQNELVFPGLNPERFPRAASFQIRVDSIRLIGRAGTTSAFAMRARQHGSSSICLSLVRHGRAVSFDCGPAHVTRATIRAFSAYAVLVPDGVTAVTLRSTDGDVWTESVRDNAAVFLHIGHGPIHVERTRAKKG